MECYKAKLWDLTKHHLKSIDSQIELLTALQITSSRNTALC